MTPSTIARSASRARRATVARACSRPHIQPSRLYDGRPVTSSWNPGSMKSGPTLKAWTVKPLRRNASRSPSVTVVLPTPLATPAMTRRRADLEMAELIPRPPAKTGVGGARPGRSPGSRIVLLPAPSRLTPVACAGFVPGYSDGVAAGSHRLPLALLGTLDAKTWPRLAEIHPGCNSLGYDANRGMRRLRPDDWRRNVWALTLTVFISFVGFQFFSPFLPLYIRELGVTDPAKIALWAGAQAAVTPAMSGILSPVFGRLADRFGRKMMLIRSLVGFVVIVAAMGLVTSVEQLFLARVVMGLFSGFTPMVMALATTSAPRDKVPAAIGMVQSAQLLSVAVGPAIGGYVASHFGIRYAFFATARLCAVALLGLILLFREVPAGPPGAPPGPCLWAGAACSGCARSAGSAWAPRSP